MTSVRPNGAQTLTSSPPRRPRGIPRNAIPAIAFISLLLVGEPMILSANILVFTNDWSDFWNIMPYFIFGGPILVVIPIVIASNSGDVRVLQLVRPAAYFIQALWVLNTALAIVSICIFDFDQSVPSVGTIGLELILLYPIWMMRQSIKVSRWLDPNSRPDEWEIPAINDPNDRAYRGPKSKKKGKQSPPPADHL